MLWNASSLNGYPIKATDGLSGTVSDVMYQDTDWAIRWLVVDLGDWLSGRRVLLPISALGSPDPEAHHLPVRLTMRQIEQSPDIDTSMPLSQKTDVQACDHFDLPHGRDQFLWAGQEGRPADVAEAPPGTAATGEVKTAAREGRVRSMLEVTGNSIEATDGDIGHAEDFLIDIAAWQVRYLVVHTSSWWAGEKLLVSPLSIDWIDWARCIIHLDVTRQKVKDSPPYRAAETVDGAFEELFHSYYGFRGPRR